MPILLMVLFIIAEIVLFIEIGERIGTWMTVGCIMLTAILGILLWRVQGLSVVRQLREARRRREMPVNAVFDGVCLIVAGFLLLTPGFLTDAVGIALFVPMVRQTLGGALWRAVRERGVAHVHVGPRGTRFNDRTATYPEGPGPTSAATANKPPVSDAAFEDIPPSNDSPWNSRNDTDNDRMR